MTDGLASERGFGAQSVDGSTQEGVSWVHMGGEGEDVTFPAPGVLLISHSSASESWVHGAGYTLSHNGS